MEVIKIQGVDEEVYFTTSQDGLPIYIWNDAYAKSFHLSLNVGYGSIHTEFFVNGKKYQVPNGIAHFMEHVKFNVKKDVTANDLFDPLGSDINAFTTFLYTSYYVMGTSEVTKNLNCLLDFVYNPYFTKGLIAKEKGIIISEANMGFDQPYNQLYFEFYKSIFQKEKYRNYICGEVEDIKKIELADIRLIYDTFYHPKNMFLVVTGNVNPYEIEKVVNDNLGKKEFKKYQNPTFCEVKEPRKVNQEHKEITANVEVAKAKVGLKLNRSDFASFHDTSLNILFSLILNSNFGDTSILKEELLEEGLVTYLNASRLILKDYIIIDITIESKYVNEAIKRIIETLKDLKMSEEDLKRKVNSSIATLVTNYDSSEQVSRMIENYLIYYKKLIPNIKEVYESITMEDIKKVISKIKTDNLVTVVMDKNAN